MEYDSTACRVLQRAVKYPRLEFKTGNLHLILPPGFPAHELLEKHRKWIFTKSRFINECLREARDKPIAERTANELREIIHAIAESSSKKLGGRPNGIYFRKMKTKWASLSPKKNLTVNVLMKYLPEQFIEYIVFHEMVHLKEKKHGYRFWEIVSKQFPDYQKREKELFVYWFRLAALI